jgi:hypothetical protein
MDETGTIQIMREHQSSRLLDNNASSCLNSNEERGTKRSEVEGSPTTDKMLEQAHYKLSHPELVSGSFSESLDSGSSPE